MRLLASCCFIVALAACSTPSSTVAVDSGPDAITEVATGDNSGLDLSSLGDGQSADTAEDTFELVPQETAEETTGPACEVGEGCFLDPCQYNDDCLSSWCVGHMGEDVCTLQCQSECPPDGPASRFPGRCPTWFGSACPTMPISASLARHQRTAKVRLG